MRFVLALSVALVVSSASASPCAGGRCAKIPNIVKAPVRTVIERQPVRSVGKRLLDRQPVRRLVRATWIGKRLAARRHH